MHNQVVQFETKNEAVYVELKQPLTEGEPSGTMITDSDSLSFVYLIDIGKTYAYVHFKEDVWDAFNPILEQNMPMILRMNDRDVVLPNVREELTMLLDNMYGNGNYGELTDRVEQHFASYFDQ